MKSTTKARRHLFALIGLGTLLGTGCALQSPGGNRFVNPQTQARVPANVPMKAPSPPLAAGYPGNPIPVQGFANGQGFANAQVAAGAVPLANTQPMASYQHPR